MLSASGVSSVFWQGVARIAAIIAASLWAADGPATGAVLGAGVGLFARGIAAGRDFALWDFAARVVAGRVPAGRVLAGRVFAVSCTLGSWDLARQRRAARRARRVACAERLAQPAPRWPATLARTWLVAERTAGCVEAAAGSAGAARAAKPRIERIVIGRLRAVSTLRLSAGGGAYLSASTESGQVEDALDSRGQDLAPPIYGFWVSRLRTAPRRAAPRRTAPRRTAPRRTAPRRTAPRRTAPRRTAPRRPRRALAPRRCRRPAQRR